MKKIILSLAFILVALHSFAQQELQMSQYLFNGMFWNPGYTGSNNDYVRFTAMYRHQWTAIAGAPRTGMFSADIPLKHDNMGIGLQIVSDHIGVSSLNEVFATYAYQVRFNENLALGLGIRGGVSVYSARLSELTVWDDHDYQFENNLRNVVMPKFGFGAYLHGKKFYVGASIPTLWAYDSDHQFNVDINKSSWMRQHIYLSTAYVFDISQNFKIKPSVFTKYVKNAPFQADVTLTLIFKEIVFLSGGYRTNAAANAMIEFRPVPALRIGYGFDLSTPKYLRVHGGTTHEIMLGYDIQQKTAKYKSPRLF